MNGPMDRNTTHRNCVEQKYVYVPDLFSLDNSVRKEIFSVLNINRGHFEYDYDLLKPRGLRVTGYVARIEETKSAYRTFVVNS
jgi:hypothetical protein